MIGTCDQARSLRDHLLAVHVRQAEVEDDDIRRSRRRRLQRFGAGHGLDHVIAGCVQRRPRKRWICGSSSTTRIRSASSGRLGRRRVSRLESAT